MTELPPLPELPPYRYCDGRYNEDEMRAYARAALAAAPQQGWVSVEERLPDLMVPVLGYTDNGAVSVFAREDGGDGWLWARQTWVWSLADVRGIEADDDYAVIYWAPLLAPPGIKQQASDEGGGG